MRTLSDSMILRMIFREYKILGRPRCLLGFQRPSSGPHWYHLANNICAFKILMLCAKGNESRNIWYFCVPGFFHQVFDISQNIWLM